MFDLEDSIRNWLRAFRKHKAFNHGSIREMELHLRDHIDDLLAEGDSEQEAFKKAVNEFGDITPMAKEEYLNLIPGSSSSYINYAMLRNYIKIAVRNFWRNKFYSFVNILGLTIGLSIVFLIGLFVFDELSFDKFHAKKDQLYRVVENQYYAGQPVFPVAVTPTALGPSLNAEYSEVVNYTRVAYNNDIFEVDGHNIPEDDGIMADASFFEMFSYPLINGSLETFKLNLNSLVLNEEMAEKYFPDRDPIGELITLDGEEYVVTGVIKNVPDNTHLPFRYVKNFEKYLSEHPDRADDWGSNWIYTYVELDPQSDLKNINEKIIGQIKANNEGSVTDIYLQPLTNIYLGEVNFVVEARNKGELQYVQIFIIVAFFILLISCINFMNLSTARSAKRAKEVGLRKTVGAFRNQLTIQFLSESILMVVLGVVLSIAVVILVLPSFNQLANKDFQVQALISSGTGVYWGLGVIVVSIITGLLAGSYPAIFLSSLKPVSSLKTEINSGKRGSGLRKVLVVFQFTISVVLIIGTIVVFRQLNYIQNKNLGYDKENIITMSVPDNDMIESFESELREDPRIVNAGASNNHPAYVMNSTSGFSWKGKDPESTILIHYMGVDENYMKTMKMELLEGRNFTVSDSLGIIINEKALEIMGFDEPLGEIVSTDDEELTIIGVVKDFNFKSIRTPIEPLIIYTTKDLYRLFIRVPENGTKEALAVIDEKMEKFFPDSEFEYHFLDEDFEDLYKAERRTSKISTYFAVLAIFISCLGLFGLVSYASEQRTKEIGIRKVLGASVRNLFILLTGDFTRLVIFSLLISIPIGWFVMDKWLEGFAYHITLSAWIFIISGITALLIALFTVSFHTIRATFSNPVNALRSE